MATLKYILQGTKSVRNIYVRLSLERGKVFKRKTAYSINKGSWSIKKAEPIQRDGELKELKSNLDELKNHLYDKINEATANKVIVDGAWLQSQLNLYHEKVQEEDENLLVVRFEHYIKELKFKRHPSRNTPITKATITKYNTIKKKLIAFEKLEKKSFRVRDVDLAFRTNFIRYLENVEKISDNTIGRYISVIITVCRNAKLYGIQTNTQLEAVKAFSNEVNKIYFSFEELEKIRQADLDSYALNNSRDWLLIGCFIGQRVSDLLTLTTTNIVNKKGITLIMVRQQKTHKDVYIPLHPIVQEILDKRHGHFPDQIADQTFNINIKKVAKQAGIIEPTHGGVIEMVEVKGKAKPRKIYGVYPKWQLITSHICRRSFASNFYGEMPTYLIKTITGHASENQFYKYVGKPPLDHAEEMAKYLNSIHQKQNQTTS